MCLEVGGILDPILHSDCCNVCQVQLVCQAISEEIDDQRFQRQPFKSFSVPTNDYVYNQQYEN